MNSLLYLSALLAEVDSAAPATWDMGVDHLLRALLAVCVFSLVGVAVLAVAVWAMCRLVPFSMRKEIEEDQNVALGIIMGSLIIGISIIIAASVAS
jgi:putative membrane protein